MEIKKVRMKVKMNIRVCQTFSKKYLNMIRIKF